MTTIDAGGCAPPVHAMTDRQADQHTADRLRAENLTRAEAAERVGPHEARHRRHEALIYALGGHGTVGGEAPGDQL